jgi:hypothetical protein
MYTYEIIHERETYTILALGFYKKVSQTCHNKIYVSIGILTGMPKGHIIIKQT